MSSEGQNNSRFIIVCHVERRGLGPEVETSRQRGTFTIATRTGSRSYDRRDSSTAPSASLGMTEQFTMHDCSVSIMLSEGRSPKSKHLDGAAYPIS